MSPSQGPEHPPPAPSALHLHRLGQGSILGEHFGVREGFLRFQPCCGVCLELGSCVSDDSGVAMVTSIG